MATTVSHLTANPFGIHGDLHYLSPDVQGPVMAHTEDYTETDKKRKAKVNNRMYQTNDLSIYKLMTQKVKSGESMLNYAARLRKFADKCDFQDWSADKMIKSMVLVNMKDKELRLLLLSMDLNLDEVLDKVKAKEDTGLLINTVSGHNEGINDNPLIHSGITQDPQVKETLNENEAIVKTEILENDQKDQEDTSMGNSTQDPTYFGDMFKDTDGLGSQVVGHIGDHYSMKEEQCPEPAQDFSDDEHTGSDDFAADLPVPESTQDAVNHSVPFTSGTTNKDKSFDSAGDSMNDAHVNDLTSDSIEPENANNVEKPHKCIACGKRYKRTCTLYRHMKTHTEDKSHTCTHCGKQFREAGILRNHIRTHTGEKPYTCPQCNKQFTQLGSLKVHILSHTGEKPHVCAKCNKRFTKSSDLRQHERIHTGEKPYICTICGNMFRLSSILRQHMKIHTGEKPYPCPDCGTAFRQISALKKHELTHTGERPHQCSECGKQFAQMGTLRIHMKYHTEDRPHPCCVCSKRFKSTNDLKVHMMIHTGERPHKCTYCERQFTQSGALKEHMMTHTGERPHKCTECTKSFIKKTELKIHMRIHTGEKPHKCPQCEMQFTQRSNLRAHIRTHTGEKPYECTTCGLQFTQSSSLKRHQSVHNKEK